MGPCNKSAVRLTHARLHIDEMIAALRIYFLGDYILDYSNYL